MRYIFIYFFLFVTTVSRPQTITATQVTGLPAVINESSGLEINSRNKIFSHNDSGGNPEIYQFDTTGILNRTITISNATNVDWEDLAQDSLGNIYIGDFGNNNNDRQDLKIYKIINPDSFAGNSISAQIINFTYPDQTAFPPPNSDKNFDMEGFFDCNNSLYLFSKNLTNPYSGYTKLYKLPDTAGTYVAQLLDSFYTGPGPFLFYSISGADINPNHSAVVLLSYNQLWLFTNFTGDAFFSGTILHFTISNPLTQKEGICFISDTELYFSDETVNGTGGYLYYANLQPFLNIKLPAQENNKVYIYPNPSSNNYIVSFSGKGSGLITVELYTQLGEKLQSISILKNSDEIRIPVETNSFSKGIYILKVFNSDGLSEIKKVVKQ